MRKPRFSSVARFGKPVYDGRIATATAVEGTDGRLEIRVESEGVEGVICGRAIYSGALDFAKAQARADELNGESSGL